MYLTYSEYLGYGGTLGETAFVDYEFGAEIQINYRTFNRLKGETNIPEQVKILIVQLVNLADTKSKTLTALDNDNIKKQTNDGVSIEYNNMSAVELFEACKSQVSQYINEYLYDITNSKGHKLLYRGLYPGE